MAIWLCRRHWQCTWQTVGWSISFPKGNDRGLPLLQAAPLCACKSWELGGLSINGRFGVRPEKSSSPISISKSETLSAGRSLLAAACMHKDTCCPTLIQRFNQSRCLQPNKHKCHLVFSLLSFTWLKKKKWMFAVLHLASCSDWATTPDHWLHTVFNVRPQDSQYCENIWTRYDFPVTVSL